MPQFPRVQILGVSLERVALVVVLVAAVIFGVYHILSKENAHRQSRPEIPGLDDISECGTLTSFDGTKTIDFDRDHKIGLTEKSPDGDEKSERKSTGTWSFDEENERYTVSLQNASVSYQLVKPEDASVCILAPGDDVEAVNLRESWFGKIEEQDDDEDD